MKNRAGAFLRRSLSIMLVLTMLWSKSSVISLAAALPTDNLQPVESTAPSEAPLPTEMLEPQETSAPTETEEPRETPSPAETEEPTEAPLPAETGGSTETPLPTEAEKPIVTPSPTETEEPTAVPSASVKGIAEDALVPFTASETGEKTAYIEGGEGVYQEGAFQVLGGSEDPSEYNANALTESKREEAENYLYEQLAAKKTEINLSSYMISRPEINAFVFGVINDHPELYFVKSSFEYSYNASNIVTKVRPQFLQGYDDAQFNRAVDSAMAVIKEGMTDLERAVALHDYLVVNCEYDYDDYLTNTIPDTSYSAYGVLVNRTGVCQGYALAYKLLLNKAGIECYMVTSDSMCHAWNLIKLNGEYYQVDVTWDDPVEDYFGLAHHEYMLRSDNDFGRHTDWKITKGSQVVELTADDTAYDEAFWENVISPIVVSDGTFFYINNSAGTIEKRASSGGSETIILDGIGTWYVWGSTVSFWGSVYSGLFKIGDRLYYNTQDRIYSISIEGGTACEETIILSNETGNVYGSAYVQGKLKYVLLQNPNDRENPLINTAEFLSARQLNEPAFSPLGGTIDKGESVTLSAEDETDIYYTTDGSQPIPGEEGTNLYALPIVIEADTTIKAIATSELELLSDSNVATAEYQTCTNNLVLAETSISLKEGEKHKLDVSEVPTTRTISDISWVSLDESKATVDQNGEVTALLAGATTVEAIVTDHKGRTVTASCKVNIEESFCQVTFMGKNSTKPLKAESVRFGGTAQPPVVETVPTGYRFIGWDKPYSNVRQNLVINAEYETIIYNINYEINGGVNSAENPQSYTVESENLELEDAYGKEGYSFAGWYTSADMKGNRVSVIEKGSAGDITLYAGWKDERGLWMEDIPAQKFTGKAIKPDTKVYYGDRELTPGKDYTVSYKNNTAANILETEAQLKKAPTILIKGKGDYAGTVSRTFAIEPKNIEENDVQIDNLAVSYNKGKLVKPAPVVKWNGKRLSTKDYTVEYPDSLSNESAYKEPGKYTVRIEGIGNYTGTKDITLTIADGESNVLMSKVKISKIPDQSYNGNDIELTQDMPRLTYQNKQLELGADYELKYGKCRETGTYDVLIVGKGTYVGEIHTSFKITGIPASKMKIGKLPSRIYTGEAITFDPNAAETESKLWVTDAQGGELQQGIDYTVEYENNENVGTARIIFTGRGRYVGTVKKTFRIVACSVSEENSDVKAVFENETQTYLKGGAKPKVKVTFKGEILEEGIDYTLSYRNNTSTIVKNNKYPTVTIKGKKNFSDSRTLSFVIEPKDISDVTVIVPDMTENAKAGKYCSTPVLTDENGKKLSAGTDYEKQYVYMDANGMELDKNDRPVAGDILTIVIKGKGNYAGTASATFRIVEKGKNLSNARVTFDQKYYYTGERITPAKGELTVKLGNSVLSTDDYEIIECSDNLKVGTAKLVIRGKGEYGGTKQVSFRIFPQVMQWWKQI